MLVFYTAGVDRNTKAPSDFIAGLGTFGSLGGALAANSVNSMQEKLWTSFQNKVVKFINDHGGMAGTMTPMIESVDWEVAVITHNLSNSEVE